MTLMYQIRHNACDCRVDFVNILIYNSKPILDKTTHMLFGSYQIDGLNSKDARLLFFLQRMKYSFNDLVIGRVEYIEIICRLLINYDSPVHNRMPTVQCQTA